MGGQSVAEVARALEVHPSDLHRWNRELQEHGLETKDREVRWLAELIEHETSMAIPMGNRPARPIKKEEP